MSDLTDAQAGALITHLNVVQMELGRDLFSEEMDIALCALCRQWWWGWDVGDEDEQAFYSIVRGMTYGRAGSFLHASDIIYSTIAAVVNCWQGESELDASVLVPPLREMRRYLRWNDDFASALRHLDLALDLIEEVG